GVYVGLASEFRAVGVDEIGLGGSEGGARLIRANSCPAGELDERAGIRSRPADPIPADERQLPEPRCDHSLPDFGRTRFGETTEVHAHARLACPERPEHV